MTCSDQCLSLTSSIPECGSSCIFSAATEVGCAATDLDCQCSSSASSALLNKAQTCVISSCSDISTALLVQSAYDNVCSCEAGQVTTVNVDSFPSETSLATLTSIPQTSLSPGRAFATITAPSGVLESISLVTGGPLTPSMAASTSAVAQPSQPAVSPNVGADFGVGFGIPTVVLLVAMLVFRM